ncbi:hypothetical protein Tco_1475898 [Tanacetum coccineum]
MDAEKNPRYIAASPRTRLIQRRLRRVQVQICGSFAGGVRQATKNMTQAARPQCAPRQQNPKPPLFSTPPKVGVNSWAASLPIKWISPAERHERLTYDRRGARGCYGKWGYIDLEFFGGSWQSAVTTVMGMHYNICYIPQRQIRGIPGDLSLGIHFPGDMSPGISGTE